MVMSRALLLLAAFAVLSAHEIRAQNRRSLPDYFYISAHVFSDAAPHWFEYVLDVQADGTGSLVRHIRIAPAADFCPNDVTVRGLQKKVGESPDSLSGSVNLCSISV